jgi:phosphoserine aminotransferase
MPLWNFAPGPAALPTEVMRQAREEFLDWNQGGTSVMEVSHRSPAFLRLAREAEADLRALLAIPDAYEVLFMQGGASAQFALVPLNLTAPGELVDYVNTGHWSGRAIEEAGRLCRVHVAADAGPAYTSVPRQAALARSRHARYLHYTSNETIGGVQFDYVPDAHGTPLVADMSSDILSRPLEVAKFGLIYAGAQKNIGPSGLVIVIVHKELLGRARPETPSVFDYRKVAADGSMLNTPPTFAWYMAGLVFKWLRRQGGLAAMELQNRAKAEMLYRAIDGSEGFYRNAVAPAARSWMNVTFTLQDPTLDAVFLDAAAAAGLLNLKGHRVVGGMRASLYNAMPLAGVLALCEFMRDFARRRA